MKKKVVITIVSFALVACMAITGTLAYLSSVPNSIKNLFVLGSKIDVDFTEKELNTDEDGNHIYKVTPGVAVTKTAVVTVNPGSDASYVFIEIKATENFSEYFEEYSLQTNLVGEKGWTELDVEGNSNKVYFIEVPAIADDGDPIELNVFADNELMAKTTFTSFPEDGEVSLELFAAAIQKDALEDAAAAWDALTAENGSTLVGLTGADD